MRETSGGVAIDFIYDADGRPFAMKRNGAYYYYILNLQGDVIRLVNSSGATVASYEYDPYGKVISATGSMAAINPLRYRSYYYDSETGLYFLMSRYYDPAICRFINADDYSSTGQGIIGHNMFAYCGNNPVSRADDGGEFWNVVIGAVVGGAIGAISTALSGGSTSEIWLSAACGAISGGLAATGFGGLAGQIILGAVTSAVDSGYQNYNDYAAGEATLGEAIISTAVDTVLGATFGAMGFEGTDALKASNKMAKNAHSALKSITKKVVHPTVKSSAKTVLRQSGKYITKEIKQSLIDNILTSALSYGVGMIVDLY